MVEIVHFKQPTTSKTCCKASVQLNRTCMYTLSEIVIPVWRLFDLLRNEQILYDLCCQLSTDVTFLSMFILVCSENWLLTLINGSIH